MMTRIPACRHIRTALSTSFLGGSNMPTQPTKVRSDWEEQMMKVINDLLSSTEWQTSSNIPKSFHQTVNLTLTTNMTWTNCLDCYHLIVSEGCRVLQVQTVHVRRCVPRCHRKASQCVSARPPLPHNRQKLFSNHWAQRHASRAADSNVITALQDTFWSSLIREVWEHWIINVTEDPNTS